MFSSYGTGQQPPPVHQESGFKGLKTTLQQSSPFQENLLASGGELDLCIKFWNTQTGLCLSEVELARRPQMDALWPLQPRMRRFKLGMCLGFREFQNPYEKKICCHLLIHTPFVEDHVNAG